MGFFIVGVMDRGVLKFKIYRRGQVYGVMTLDRLMIWLEEKEKRARLG